MSPMQRMSAHAAAGRFALQRCSTCGAAQYPPRELCSTCLRDTLEWHVSTDECGELLATTMLHHSHDPSFRARLPLRVGLVRLDTGATTVCFLCEGCSAGTRVRVSASNDAAGRAILAAVPA